MNPRDFHILLIILGIISLLCCLPLVVILIVNLKEYINKFIDNFSNNLKNMSFSVDYPFSRGDRVRFRQIYNHISGTITGTMIHGKYEVRWDDGINQFCYSDTLIFSENRLITKPDVIPKVKKTTQKTKLEKVDFDKLPKDFIFSENRYFEGDNDEEYNYLTDGDYIIKGDEVSFGNNLWSESTIPEGQKIFINRNMRYRRKKKSYYMI